MSLTLAEGRAAIRSITRHVAGDPRLSDAQCDEYLNTSVRNVRAWMSIKVPSRYLYTTDEITVDDSGTGTIVLAAGSGEFSNCYRVERLNCDGEWDPVRDAADPARPGRAQWLNFRIEGTSLIIGPDRADTTGTYRILYHSRPALLTTDAAVFPIVPELEMALKYGACALIALHDPGDSLKNKAAWDAELELEYKRQIPILSDRYGTHRNNSGLRREKGY